VGLCALLWTASAQAAPGIVEDGRCEPPPPPGDCVAGGRCADDTGTCNALDGVLRLCVPDDALVCCDSDVDCPYDPTGTAGLCIGSVFTGAGLCTNPDAEYCAGASIRPTAAQVERCHRDPEGNLGRWGNGDCDGDGLTNLEETESLGTDPCVAPLPRAVWVGEACVPLTDDEGCFPGDSCDTDPVDSACTVTSDGSGTECYPSASLLYCGDGVWACPDGTDEVRDDLYGHVWCVPPA